MFENVFFVNCNLNLIFNKMKKYICLLSGFILCSCSNTPTPPVTPPITKKTIKADIVSNLTNDSCKIWQLSKFEINQVSEKIVDRTIMEFCKNGTVNIRDKGIDKLSSYELEIDSTKEPVDIKININTGFKEYEMEIISLKKFELMVFKLNIDKTAGKTGSYISTFIPITKK